MDFVSISRDNPSMQCACLAGVFRMAESLGLLFNLFKEVLADNLPQEQVLLGANDGAVLFLLAAGQPPRKEHICTKNFYKITVPTLVIYQRTSEVTYVCHGIQLQFWNICFWSTKINLKLYKKANPSYVLET